MAVLQQATLQHLLRQHHSLARSSARDGYGCGGVEVFAFLAFLLALLDLLLDLNDMMDADDARRLREVRSAGDEEGSQRCSARLEVREAAWAAEQVGMGVLEALRGSSECRDAHVCKAAAAAAAGGPLAEAITRLAGEWLERWPGLRKLQLGKVVLSAASNLTCHAHSECHGAASTTSLPPPTPEAAHSRPPPISPTQGGGRAWKP